jgi:hypothetical protein
MVPLAIRTRSAFRIGVRRQLWLEDEVVLRK